MLKIDNKYDHIEPQTENFRRASNFPPWLSTIALLPEVSRNENEMQNGCHRCFVQTVSARFHFLCIRAAKIMKRLISGQSKNFFNI
jgi:hypothetical protein